MQFAFDLSNTVLLLLSIFGMGGFYSVLLLPVDPSLTCAVQSAHIYIHTSPPLTHFPKTEVLLLPFSTDCSTLLMCHRKMISQRNDAFYFEVHGFVCDLAEQSWAVMAEL